MKALQCTGPQPVENNPLQATEMAIHQPVDKEILLQVHACGICHTDLHIIEGELPQKKSPLIPGHQIVGVVKRIGKNVTGYKYGDRVGVPWLYWACGECEFCRRGDENLCESAKFTGYDVDGGFAEQVIAHSDFVYAIPYRFSDEEAAPLLCAGIIGFRALRLSNIKPGERIGLYGFGASAHIAIQVALHWKCEVYVFSRSEQHRKFAQDLGAAWTGTADEVPPKPLDSAISFAPVGDLVPLALCALRKGGTLALAGIYMTPVPSFDYSLLYHERTIRSVANSTRQDANDFLKLAEQIPVRTQVELFALQDANRAMQLLKKGEIHGAGVLKVGT
ncbi:MAG: zinc-dependent alcohol dehydrogenase family protein [Bacteroidota bacterium]|jgi:propanol-preferring alcohol dehydrogenase